MVPLIPGVGHLLAKHQRGHGDTILRYEDRSYEGAAWKRVQDTDALKVGGFDLIRLTGIAGWDARSFWVVGTGPSSAAVIHYDDGHWSTGIKYRFAPYSIQRAVARDTLILAGGVDTGYGGGTLHKVDPTGLVDYGHVNLNSLPRLDSQEICLIAPDLFYYFTSDRHGTVVKIAGDKRSDMSIDKYKELLVHRKDNVPLKEYPVSDVRLTRTCKVGHALGVFSPKGYGESLLVDYRDGIWYALLVLGRHGLQDMWVGLVGDQKLTVVCVGQDGYVVRIRDCRQSFDIVEQTVPVSGEVTSGRLLKVWGVSLDKYWTMDENGTVWEWLSGRWRVVVRGLYRNDVTFKSAWVSPEGVVLAITQNAVYRLE